MSDPLCLAYYCSGHGYGHATRVSAFARYLLSVKEESRPLVYIISTAPERIFSDSIAQGAKYRYAEIDPVIVQPLAYRVDRRKSVDVLRKFLSKKQDLLDRECRWLLEIKARCVLSDAAFLGCLAAKKACLPSILITNFSFDSVYSYFSTPLLDASTPAELKISNDIPNNILEVVPDIPIPHNELAPLVEEIHMGYRCADLLIRLPGHIPIPSFAVAPSLPSFEWIDADTRKMRPAVLKSLITPIDNHSVLPNFPFYLKRKTVKRSIMQAPLLVRPTSSEFSVYTSEGRSKFLSSIGVPPDQHDPIKTKILIVSFGGQVFRRPSSSPPSRTSSQEFVKDASAKSPWEPSNRHDHALKPIDHNHLRLDGSLNRAKKTILTSHCAELHIPSPTFCFSPAENASSSLIATAGHIWIPGAPATSKPPLSQSVQSNNSPLLPIDSKPSEIDILNRLLPDSSWIAVVCGVSKDQWNSQNEGHDSELPKGFYVAPRDVYMPDLNAVGDVLLGKLVRTILGAVMETLAWSFEADFKLLTQGYGTVSECVDSCTPFVYVSRPLFIEEHGLRLLLEQEGVGVELSRQAYEAGDWVSSINEAYINGRKIKEQKRRDMMNGIGIDKREQEGKKLAATVIEWIKAWWQEDSKGN